MLKNAGTPSNTRSRAISRRSLLQGVGVSLSLPLLNIMAPAAARAEQGRVPRRMFGICNNLGLLPGEFFPSDAGRSYTPSPYLRLLQDHRDDFTVISGVSHPNVDGGHPSDISFLTAAPHPASSSFRNTISLDQYIAEHIGGETRFPSLTLAVNTASRSLSWTGSGVAIPPEQSVAGVFRQMFIQGAPEEVEAKIAELETCRSILDAVADLGDANAHSTTNMPTLFAGGGFKHAGHLAFDKGRNYPLPNLFVSMLQRMGIEDDQFASSTGAMAGLEMTAVWEPRH